MMPRPKKMPRARPMRRPRVPVRQQAASSRAAGDGRGGGGFEVAVPHHITLYHLRVCCRFWSEIEIETSRSAWRAALYPASLRRHALCCSVLPSVALPRLRCGASRRPRPSCCPSPHGVVWPRQPVAWRNSTPRPFSWCTGPWPQASAPASVRHGSPLPGGFTRAPDLGRL
jgi:hypothetical protein